MEMCTVWRCVLCGGVCYVEVCGMWRCACALLRCVPCGGVYYVQRSKTGILVRDGVM